MRWIRDQVVEPRRPWYEAGEIERIVATKVYAFQGASAAVLNLEAFAERACGVALDQHAVLPDRVLGVTVFGSRARPHILINRALTEAADRRGAPLEAIGRWRATLAHEIGHVLLHRGLYLHHGDQIELFGRDEQTGTAEVQCHRSDLVAGATHWREVQANTAMAALLMPSDRFAAAFGRRLNIVAQRGDSAARSLIRGLAEEFMVSRQAALIRISELGLMTSKTRLL